MKDILFNKKELGYILKGLYSVQHSYSGISAKKPKYYYDLKNLKNVRAIISKIQEVK
jgi:hypothetical protein